MHRSLHYSPLRPKQCRLGAKESPVKLDRSASDGHPLGLFPALRSAAGDAPMKPQILFCNILVSTFLISGLAVAQAPLGLNDNTQPTDFSGKSGSEKKPTLSKSYSANGAITGLAADEDSDDPCYLELKYVDVVTRQPQNSIKFAHCSGKDGNPKDGVATARRDINLTGGRMATGVRVVLNKDGDKIKGDQAARQFRRVRARRQGVHPGRVRLQFGVRGCALSARHLGVQTLQYRQSTLQHHCQLQR